MVAWRARPKTFAGPRAALCVGYWKRDIAAVDQRSPRKRYGPLNTLISSRNIARPVIGREPAERRRRERLADPDRQMESQEMVRQ